ncbi:hypothetical protein LguiB_032611 [Lonicera macranthoides]
MTAEADVGMAFEDPFKEFTSKHPFFHVVLSLAYVGQVLLWVICDINNAIGTSNTSDLFVIKSEKSQNYDDDNCIPAKFWKSYIDEPGATARLQCSNKWWIVNLKDHGNSGYFSSGWSKFVKENSLQIGDACCFELIEKENFVFKVSIVKRTDSSSLSKP